MKIKVDSRLIIGGIGLVLIILYTLVLLTGYRAESTEPNKTVSKEVDGYYIFSTLLKRLGYKVEKTNIPAVFFGSGAMICLEQHTIDAMQEQRFKDWLDNGNTLFLLGLPDNETPLTETPIESADPEPVVVNPPLNKDVHEVSYKPGRYFSPAGESTVLLENVNGAVLIKKTLGKGQLYLMPDGDLFTNRYMKEEDTAVLVNNLFAPYFADPVYIYEQPELLEIMSSPVLILFKGNLFFFTIHLLLITGLFLYWKGTRFGNAVVYRPFGRRTISNHIQAVGNFYYRVKANPLIDSLEIAYFLHKIHKVVGEHKNLSEEALEQLLTDHYGVHAGDFKNLVTKETQITTEKLLARRESRNKIIQKLSRSDYGKLRKY